MYNPKQEIPVILSKVAKICNFSNYDTKYNINTVTGDGIVSELLFGSVINKNNNQCVSVAIKKASPKETQRNARGIPGAFSREIYFYTEIFPQLDDFQKKKGVKNRFSSIPRFFFANPDEMKETIVMEDVRGQGFRMTETENLLNDEQVEFVFQTCGKFHALSFAYKDQHSEEFERISEGLFKRYTDSIIQSDDFRNAIRSVCRSYSKFLSRQQDKDVLARYENFCENCLELFDKAYNYESPFKVVLHGDCWSNNLLFKYDEHGKLEDMKLIDFQLINVGSPVKDLSHFLYNSGTKEHFDNMDNLLKVYHDSFSRYYEQLGSNPDKLPSLSTLKDEWKNCASFGLVLSLLLCKIKLIDKKEFENFSETDDTLSDFFKLQVANEDVLAQRIRDILHHAYDMGFI